MTTRKTTPRMPPAPPLPDDPEQLFDLSQPGEDIPPDVALMAALAQLGQTADEARCIVYRIDDKSKKDIWLFEVPVAEFSINDIQARYGAGEYRIRVYSADAGIITHRRIAVGDPLTPAALVTPAAPVYMQSSAQDAAPMMGELSRVMMEGFRQLAEMLKPPPTQAMGVREIVELMGVINANKAPAVDPIAQALQLVALRDKLAPLPVNAETGEVDGSMLLMKGLDTFGPLVKSIMDQSQQNRAVAGTLPAAPVRTLAAPVAPPLAANPAVSAPILEDQPVNIALAAVKAPLLIAAASNSDPWNFAGMVVQFFDPMQIQQYIHAQDWFTQVCNELPEARQYPDWFEQLRADVLEQIRENNQAESGTAGLTPGNETGSVKPLETPPA